MLLNAWVALFLMAFKPISPSSDDPASPPIFGGTIYSFRERVLGGIYIVSRVLAEVKQHSSAGKATVC